jgi:hypothetical protein
MVATAVRRGFGPLAQRYGPPPAAKPHGPQREAVAARGGFAGYGAGGAYGWLLGAMGGAGGAAAGETAEQRAAYPELAFREGSILANILRIVGSVGSLDFQSLPASKSQKDQEVAAGWKECVTSCWGFLGLPRVVWEIVVPALITGSSLSHVVLNDEITTRGQFAGRRMLRAIKSKAPGTYELKVDPYNNVTAVKDPSQDGRLLPPGQFVHYNHLSLYGDVAGLSLIRGAYRAATLKHWAWATREFFADKYVGPFISLSGVPMDQPKKVAAALATLKAARQSGVAVFDQDAAPQVLDLAGSSADVFAQFIEDCDREIDVAMGGSHLHMQEGQSGTDRHGDTKTHREIAGLTEWWVAADVGGLLRGASAVWVDENYRGADLPVCKLGGVDASVTKVDLENAVLANTLVDLSREEIHERCGFSPPKDDADRVPRLPPKGAAAPQRPPGAPAAGAQGFADGEAGGGWEWLLEAVP